MDLRAEYEAIRTRARAIAGSPADILARVRAHHGVYEASARNHVFPLLALHGALWAYRFFEVTGTLGEIVSYRYAFDADERARRLAMVASFAEGFRAVNREVFVDTFTSYHFTARHGETPGADTILSPRLLEALAEVRENFKVSDTFVPVSAYIFARAFSSGAVALSGVEAISNGIPAFRKPTSKNAATTLVWMSLILGSGFLGISMIATWMKPTPSESESVISLMGKELMGQGVPYYFLQFATMAILILAANTAYADFPRLAAILGKDGYLPRQFAARGDRLVFSNGVLILAVMASVLLVVFQGDVSKLIPLYAVGVFTSFTLSQTGMVRHHLKEKAKGWRLSMAFSIVGAIATGIVMIVVIVSKFLIGAWIIVVIVPIIVIAFKGVSRHYHSVAQQLRITPEPETPVLQHSVVVLVGGLQRSTLNALRYARSVHADHTLALSVAIDENHADKIRADWDRYGITVPLEILESPYRDLTTIVINHLDELDRRWGHDYVTVVIPEFVTPHWWQGVLHNQSALALKLRLLARRDTVVVSVPFHLFDKIEEPLADTHTETIHVDGAPVDTPSS